MYLLTRPSVRHSAAAVIVSSLVFAAATIPASAFLKPAQLRPLQPGAATTATKATAVTGLPMLSQFSPKEISAALPMMFLSTAAPVGFTATAGSTLAMMEAPFNPAIEAEVLTDLSHVGLDMATFLGPNILALRIATVAGRLFAMAADYLPDHSMLPEEFVFQIVMLTIAWVGLVQAAMLPALAAVASDVSIRDGRAFAALFRPAGTTWDQFKALSLCALDWITLDKDQVLEDNPDYTYWLYTGNITVQTSTTARPIAVSRKAGDTQDAGRALLGESRLIGESCSSSSPTAPSSLVRATAPATFLRIYTPNLQLLVKNDPRLANSIRTLLFQGMQAKLAAYQEEATA